MSTFSGPEAADLFQRYLATITAESDRGAVLVAATLLDHALENVLRKKLVPSVESDDSLFTGPYAPLRSFAAKIELAFRLGLLTRDTKRMLTIFRKLRNDLAHGVDTVAFQNEPIRDRLKAMFEQAPQLHQAIVGTLTEVLRSDPNLPITAEQLLTHPKGQRGIVDVFFACNAIALRRVELELEPITELMPPRE